MKTPTDAHELLEQMGRIDRMERGKLCVLREANGRAYYNHQRWEGGRNVSRYVPSEQVAPLQEALDGYQQFRRLSDQYADTIIARTRQADAAAVKKTTRTSPARKKRPSAPPASSARSSPPLSAT